MKRLLVIFISVFALFSLSDAQDLTPESVERRLERSNSRIEHERHGENAKTWVDRGIIFQDIFDVNIQYLYFGMSSDELALFMGEPNERQVIETEAGERNISVYDNIDINFENGRLVSWEETEVIHENPLEEAYASFQQAIKIAIAIGTDANKDVLKEFTGNIEAVVEVNNIEALKKIIRLASVTASTIGSQSSTAGNKTKQELVVEKINEAVGDIEGATSAADPYADSDEENWD